MTIIYYYPHVIVVYTNGVQLIPILKTTLPYSGLLPSAPVHIH